MYIHTYIYTYVWQQYTVFQENTPFQHHLNANHTHYFKRHSNTYTHHFKTLFHINIRGHKHTSFWDKNTQKHIISTQTRHIISRPRFCVILRAHKYTSFWDKKTHKNTLFQRYFNNTHHFKTLFHVGIRVVEVAKFQIRLAASQQRAHICRSELHTQTNTHTHIERDTHRHTTAVAWGHTYLCVCVHVCVCMCVCACSCICVRGYMCVCRVCAGRQIEREDTLICVCVCMCVCLWACLRVCGCMCVCRVCVRMGCLLSVGS